MAIPTLTETLNNAFTETWWEMRAQAADNILLATPLTAALKLAGCFKPQTGGRFIERTIRYGLGPTPQDVSKGDTLGSGEWESTTVGLWTWRYTSVHIQRSVFDDQINAGPAKITDYLTRRLGEARDALKQKMENDLLNTIVTDESGKKFQGLNDLVPPYASATTGTYGKLSRPTAYAAQATRGGCLLPSTGNTWWGPRYKQFTSPIEVNLKSDMTSLYNTISDGMEPPNLIVTGQDLFELYEDFVEDKTQIVKDAGTKLADLGFDVLRFKGVQMIWTGNTLWTANNMLMLNTSKYDIVYDPNMWFSMGPWKPAAANSTDSLAHILCAWNSCSDELRRHGRLYA